MSLHSQSLCSNSSAAFLHMASPKQCGWSAAHLLFDAIQTFSNTATSIKKFSLHTKKPNIRSSTWVLPSVGSTSSLPTVPQNFIGVLGHKDWEGCLLTCSQKPPVININIIMLKNFFQYFCASTIRTVCILLASSSLLLALCITKKRLFTSSFKKSGRFKTYISFHLLFSRLNLSSVLLVSLVKCLPVSVPSYCSPLRAFPLTHSWFLQWPSQLQQAGEAQPLLIEQGVASASLKAFFW